MNELDAAFAWLAATLTGDATLRATVGRRCFRDIAPAVDPSSRSPMVFPLVVFNHVFSHDTRGVGQYRVLTVVHVDVRIISKAGSDVSSAVGRLDDLLDIPQTGAPRTSVVVDSVTYWLHGCSRRELIAFSTDEAGSVYVHSGGTYECTISR